MKIGLIARSEIARGLAVQSKGFYDAVPVGRVLLVEMPKPDCERDDSWYPGATKVAYDDMSHTLDESTVREWLAGLDVVFSAETPYDWRLPRWAREAGVKVVLQGNPEFYRQHIPEFRAVQEPPDEWWWPSMWRPVPQIPDGRWMPVPMPDVPNVAAPLGGELRILHVIGKRAWVDRNGSEILVEALKHTRQRMHVTIHTIDGELPNFAGLRSNVTIDVQHLTRDRWAMYAGHHVMVMPRRYGGNNMPALEAAASGLVVSMPDISPNAEYAQLMFPARRQQNIQLSCGQITTQVATTRDLADHLDRLASTPEMIDEARTLIHPPRWAIWRDVYLDAFAEVIG